MTDSAPSGGKHWLERLFQSVYDHLVIPYLQTHDRLSRVAWGSAIGMFVGLTPTVGIQMYIVTLIWLLCRYGFRVRFNLTIAVSMVWVSNPVTTLPLYYLFLKTGDGLMGWLGYHVTSMTFQLFTAEVRQLAAGHHVGWLRWLLYASQVFLIEFGWPIVVGSLVYAIPFAILSYPFTILTMRRYRRYLARQQGISYEDWRVRYEVMD
ncbi:MAG TPA: DUF2062 domain-containing protein [bacterium]|nr:DUF2062 domain-containing protein [bacterium]